MKEERILDALGKIDDQYVVDAAPGKKRTVRWKIWIAAAACLTLLLAGGHFLSRGERLELPMDITVTYLKDSAVIPKIFSENLLVYLSEDELFTHFDTAVFRGTVTKIDNIEISFDGDKEYRAIAQIQIEKVYRGGCQAGETVSVLLPCPIMDDIWVEDTDVISNLKVGMTGIFMPNIYQDDSIWEQNGVTLRTLDIAPYGFADGVRYAFLETENGLLFARGAYESIADASTLDEIEDYVISMIEKTSK